LAASNLGGALRIVSGFESLFLPTTERITMSFIERQRCRFDVFSDGLDKSLRLYLDMELENPSLLPHKQIARIFLIPREGITLSELDEAEMLLRRLFGTVCIVHLAAGEF
jgi:hypothetical protein